MWFLPTLELSGPSNRSPRRPWPIGGTFTFVASTPSSHGSCANTSKEINVLGTHNTVRSWIKSQPDPTKPVGTVININSGIAGLIMPGVSAYSTSKSAVHRYMEYVAAGKLPDRLC